MDAAGLDAAYCKHYDAYGRIFSRCGLEFLAVEADSGAMGGSQSHEFMVKSEAGEDWVVTCGQCGYAANLEKAVSTAAPPARPDPSGDLTPEAFLTPGIKTIEQLTEFTGHPGSSFIKSLVLVADGQPVLALVRGDHQLSETKFQRAAGVREFRPAHPEEIVGWFGAEAGSLGPVGVAGMRILADEALRGRKNMIAGANKDGQHLRGVTPEEDFQAEYRDLRQTAAGDACARCGSPLAMGKAIEIGHIFKLGSRYSSVLGLRVQNAAGEDCTPVMGSYGIGIERILSSAVELYSDADGMVLPAAIAPFQVVITPVNIGDDTQRAGRHRYLRELPRAGAGRSVRRPRRAAGGEVQGRGPDRRAVPHRHRQEARAGAGGTGGAARPAEGRCGGGGRGGEGEGRGCGVRSKNRAAAETVYAQMQQLAAKGLVKLPSKKLDLQGILAMADPGIPADALLAALEREREED